MSHATRLTTKGMSIASDSYHHVSVSLTNPAFKENVPDIRCLGALVPPPNCPK